MKKPILFIFLSFCVLILNAQDYLINFSGTGSSTTVETVTVENLTQGKSITFAGSKTLHLMSSVTGNTPLLEYKDYPMIVYPNPSSGDFTVQFEAQKSGTISISIYDISGREISRLQQRIQGGFQSFKVDGLGNGVYTIQVLLEDQNFTQKVICHSKSNSNLSISYNGSSEAKQKNAPLKNATTEQAWQYNTGDRLKFQGTSGKYSTIVMDVPTQSKTLSFDFIECTDGDGNNYPIVKIGNQWWMAENLKTTKYNDGTLIPNETDDFKWANLISGAYCWYKNDINNEGTFGALYNGYAVNMYELPPKGWHVAYYHEWEELLDYAGGKQLASNKLRETGFKHWKNFKVSSTDEYGFTALPANSRWNYDKPGEFRYPYAVSDWWTRKEESSEKNFAFELQSEYNFFSFYGNLNEGYSVRCILGGTPVINTAPISNITISSAESGGVIVNDSDLPIFSSGLCWSRNPHPTISDMISIDSLDGGRFINSLSNLCFGTTYYVRAYASNYYGIGYGNEVRFETPNISSSISSIFIKLDNESIQAGSNGIARCVAIDQNGVTIPNVPAKWTTSSIKIAQINANGQITTKYNDEDRIRNNVEIYIKAVYNNFVDSVRLIITPDLNNWKQFFEPVPDAFPDLNAYYKETSGSAFSTVLTRADLNKDGKTDLVFHLFHFRGQDENLTVPFDSPVPNKLIALVSQSDGTLKDQTLQLFGSSAVDLAGGASRKVRVADLNKDGYPDWVYAMNREDGRPNDSNTRSQSVAVLSNGNGMYHTVAFGEPQYHHSVEILPMFDGSMHILSDQDWEYSYSNDSFIQVPSSPTRDFGTYLVYGSQLNLAPDYLFTGLSSPKEPTYLGLFKRSANEAWKEEAIFKLPIVGQVKYTDYTGYTSDTYIVSFNGNRYGNPVFYESVSLRLYPDSVPIPIVHFSAFLVSNEIDENDTVNQNEVGCLNRWMAFKSKDGLLKELDIFSDPEDSYNINFMDAIDVNNDGYEDLITYPYSRSGKPRVYLNNQKGKLVLLNESKFPDLDVGQNYTSAFADVDGDGIYDLIIWPANGCNCNTSCTKFFLYKGLRNLE